MGRWLVLALGVLSLRVAAAQDTILLRDAREIRAEVTEIGIDDIVYRNYGDAEGPLRRIGRDKVVCITYANGERESFLDDAPAPASASASASASAPAAGGGSYPWPEVTRSYAVGDLFSEDGVEGIVVRVDPSGRHGLVMSITGAWLAYGTGVGLFPLERLSGDRTDGWLNQCRVAEQVARAGLSWDAFPAFAWCAGLGPGWYLPSIDELASLWALLGKGRPARNMSEMTRVCREVNSLSYQYGGEDSVDWFFRMPMFWSSTGTDSAHVLPLVWTHKNAAAWAKTGYDINKPLNVRAFHRF